MQAARQPGATQASVQGAVSTYNQFSSQNYNPVEGGVTKALYVPEGKYAQQERVGVKQGLAFDSQGRSTGELGWYQELPAGRKVQDVNTGKLTSWMLIGGASRNAAQSGTIGFAAATPLIYEQGGVGTGKLTKAQVYAPGVLESGITADQILASIKEGTARDTFSGLGAEAYGGKVSRVDNRTLGNTTYEDVSNRAAWNLASYVNPTDVNLSKSDLPGVSIPWSVPATAPAFFALTTEGGVGTAIAAKSFVANVRREPVQEAPRNTLIIGGAEGTRYGPSIVTATSAPEGGRLIGGGKVAAASTTITTPTSPAGVETAMAAGSVPKPFITGETTAPTGQVAIPFTDVKFTIPVVSDAIKFFESPTFTSARPTSTQEVKFSSERGAEATRMFINPETNKPTRELTVPVGEPRTISTINPSTGATETVTTQDYQTAILPESRTYNTYESKKIRSGYEEFLDTNLRSRIPSIAEGEAALGAAQLVNPLNPTEKASDIIGRGITYKGAELLGINTQDAKTSGEMVTSMVSPTKGQYELFYEKPETAVVSYATMFVGGGIARGVVGASSRIFPVGTSRVMAAASTPGAQKTIGVALTALYGGSVSYEETKGFREVTPQTVASIKARGFQEGIPGAVGFGAGYNTPESVSAAYTSAKTIPSTVSKAVKELPNLPDRAYFKYVEMREPGSAISTPAASERFVSMQRKLEPKRSYGATSRENPSLVANRARSEKISERRAGSVSSKVSAQDPIYTIQQAPQPKESGGISAIFMGTRGSAIVEQSVYTPMRDTPLTYGKKPISGMVAEYQRPPPVKSPYVGVETKTPGGVLLSKAEVVSQVQTKPVAEVTSLPQMQGQQYRMRAVQEEAQSYRLPEGMQRPAPQESTAALKRMQPEFATSTEQKSGLAQGLMQEQMQRSRLQNVFTTQLSGRELTTSTKLESTQRNSQRQAEEQIQRSRVSEVQKQDTRLKTAARTSTATSTENVITTRQATSRTITQTPREIVTVTPVTTTTTGRVTTPPPTPPVVPIPLGMPGASAAGSQSLGTRSRAFTERFRVGEGVSWINIKAPGKVAPQAPKQTPALKPAKAPSVGKTPSLRPISPPTSKKPRKLMF